MGHQSAASEIKKELIDKHLQGSFGGVNLVWFQIFGMHSVNKYMFWIAAIMIAIIKTFYSILQNLPKSN